MCRAGRGRSRRLAAPSPRRDHALGGRVWWGGRVWKRARRAGGGGGGWCRRRPRAMAVTPRHRRASSAGRRPSRLFRVDRHGAAVRVAAPPRRRRLTGRPDRFWRRDPLPRHAHTGARPPCAAAPAWVYQRGRCECAACPRWGGGWEAGDRGSWGGGGGSAVVHGAADPPWSGRTEHRPRR